MALPDGPTPLDDAMEAAKKVRERQKEDRLEETLMRKKKRQAAAEMEEKQNQILNPQTPQKPTGPPKPV